MSELRNAHEPRHGVGGVDVLVPDLRPGAEGAGPAAGPRAAECARFRRGGNAHTAFAGFTVHHGFAAFPFFTAHAADRAVDGRGVGTATPRSGRGCRANRRKRDDRCTSRTGT